MRTCGSHLDRIAIVSWKKSQPVLERLEEQKELPQEKNLYMITALSTEEVIRRDIPLKLKRQAALLQALPFQLEATLPYDDAIVYPFFYPTEEGTDVVVFATRDGMLKKHLENFDSDQVSCVPIALFRWAKWLFPTEKQIAFLHENTLIAIDGEKIIFSQYSEDRQRLLEYLKTRFGHFFRILDDGPAIQDIPFEKLQEYAIPIGLALDKDGCQFRQGELTSSKLVQKKNDWIKRAMIGAIGVACLIGTAGASLLYYRERQLHKKIDAHFSAPPGSLKEKVAYLQARAPHDVFPSVQEALAWIGGFQEPIEVVHFHYSLVQSGAKIEIDYKAESAASARRFQEVLEKNPTLIDKKQKVEWTGQQDCYKLSFHLRKK